MLLRENLDAQFKQIRDQLEGEGLFWVIKNTTPLSSTGSTPDLKGTTKEVGNLSLDNLPLGGTSSLLTFRRLDAKARYTIRLLLNKFNLKQVEGANTAREIQAIIQKKYKAKLLSTRRHYLTKYVNYKIDLSTTIERAQEELSKLGYKVVKQDPSLKTLNSTN